MTKSEMKSLKIQHAEDNDTDIKITDKSNILMKLMIVVNPLTGNLVLHLQQINMTVVIKPITDTILNEMDNNKVGQDEMDYKF